MTQNSKNPYNPRNFSKEEMIEYIQNIHSGAVDFQESIVKSGHIESRCIPRLKKHKAKMEVLLKEIAEMESQNEFYPMYLVNEFFYYQDWFDRSVEATMDYRTNFSYYDNWTCYL